jgi:hypothetical protein
MAKCDYRIPEDERLANFGTNSVGSALIGTYWSAILHLHDIQVADKVNSTARTDLYSLRVKTLLKLVKARKSTISKANYEEIVDKDILPYKLVNAITGILVLI